MARLAAADGVRRVVATPHLQGWNVRGCLRAEAGVQSLLRELSLGRVRLQVYRGAELMVTHDLLEPSHHEREHTLNRSRYVLLELPMYDYPLYTEDVVFGLQMRGLVPVLAHPERSAPLQDDINRMAALARRGVLGQVTASSLTERADRKVRRCAERLVKRGFIHLIASDAHDPTRRGPGLSEGVGAAARLVGEERARAMVTRIPEAILADRPIDPSWLAPPQPARWWRVLLDLGSEEAA